MHLRRAVSKSMLGIWSLRNQRDTDIMSEQFINGHSQQLCQQRSILALLKTQGYFQKPDGKCIILRSNMVPEKIIIWNHLGQVASKNVIGIRPPGSQRHNRHLNFDCVDFNQTLPMANRMLPAIKKDAGILHLLTLNPTTRAAKINTTLSIPPAVAVGEVCPGSNPKLSRIKGRRIVTPISRIF